MRKLMSVALITSMLGGGTVLVGCDREISNKETVKQKTDGTVVKDREEVKQKPDGTVVKEEEHSEQH